MCNVIISGVWCQGIVYRIISGVCECSAVGWCIGCWKIVSGVFGIGVF